NDIFSLVEKGIKYYPPGSTGFVDVQDLVSIMIILMNDQNVRNSNFLINNVNLSYKELFEKYAKLVNRRPPSLPANRWLLTITMRAQTLLSLFGLGKTELTKDIIVSSVKKSVYSNNKITRTINYVFKPIDVSLEEISRGHNKKYNFQ